MGDQGQTLQSPALSQGAGAERLCPQAPVATRGRVSVAHSFLPSCLTCLPHCIEDG